MKHSVRQAILVLLIAFLSVAASAAGIYTTDGLGEYVYQSIRGHEILIYGRGLYQHMSAEVAMQGIAQDYVTLFIGVPLLLWALYQTQKGLRQWNYILTGIIGYFFITYLFYLNIAMYNYMFLVYVMLVGCSFFALLMQLGMQLAVPLHNHRVFRQAGLFLMINAVLITLLWLSVIVPPLLDGTIIPKQVEHYTSLPVQGFDLALFLPLSFATGYLAWTSKPRGAYFTMIYCISLSILMTALCSKILFMAMQGTSVIPVIFIIPTIVVTAMYFSYRMIRSM